MQAQTLARWNWIEAITDDGHARFECLTCKIWMDGRTVVRNLLRPCVRHLPAPIIRNRSGAWDAVLPGPHSGRKNHYLSSPWQYRVHESSQSSSAPSSPLLCCLLSWPFTRPDDYRKDGKRGNRKWMIDKMANEIGWLVNSSKNITTTLTARLHSREYYYYITLPTFFPARFSAQLDRCSEPGYTAHISLRCSSRLVVKRLD
jgi:hypothetical protein